MLRKLRMCERENEKGERERVVLGTEKERELKYWIVSPKLSVWKRFKGTYLPR